MASGLGDQDACEGGSGCGCRACSGWSRVDDTQVHLQEPSGYSAREGGEWALWQQNKITSICVQNTFLYHTNKIHEKTLQGRVNKKRWKSFPCFPKCKLTAQQNAIPPCIWKHPN